MENRLIRLAQAFYTQCEAPSDEDWETVFTMLVHHQHKQLIEFLKSAGITELNDGEQI